jgi:hypothetical protein
VRGLVRGMRFCFGRTLSCQNTPRTWMAGRIRDHGPTTFIDVRIGPNPIAGVLRAVLLALLAAGALIATRLALTTPLHDWRLVTLSWAVVGTFVALFFVLPAADQPLERDFLLRHLTKTLEAVPLAETSPVSRPRRAPERPW